MNLDWIQIASASQPTMKYCKDITYIIILIAASGSCWNFFPSLIDFKFKDAFPDSPPAQIEYFYGKCNKRVIEYTKVHVTNKQVTGRFFITGWLNITNIPKCIILRGKAIDPDIDVYKSTSYSFQICVPQINFLHSQKRWKYFFYEWIIPHDVADGIDWDIYFLGPNRTDWV